MAPKAPTPSSSAKAPGDAKSKTRRTKKPNPPKPLNFTKGIALLFRRQRNLVPGGGAVFLPRYTKKAHYWLDDLFHLITERTKHQYQVVGKRKTPKVRDVQSAVEAMLPLDEKLAEALVTAGRVAVQRLERSRTDAQ